MIVFREIIIRQEGSDDWRAFLTWYNSEPNMVYELRGYGSNPEEAAASAWKRFNSDRNIFITDSWEE